jgi:glycosyltransferase involved in cell wall biosynthesis
VRVALITEQLLAPVPGGVGRYTRELGAALAATAGDTDSVSGWTAWHRDLAGAQIAGVAGPRRLALPRRALSAAWARGLGPAPRMADIVHAPSPLLPPRRGRPLVVTIQDTVPWTHPETLTAHGARWHRTMAERAVATGAVITATSHTVAEELPRVLRGLNPDCVRVLGAGIPPALSREPGQEDVTAVQRRLALPERYVLSLATLEPRKGLDVLLAALARLGSAAPSLLVVGQPGWGGIDVSSAAIAAGLSSGTVRALGWLPDAELAVVLRAATALVAPSRAEGFGLPVAEAMALGVPAIISSAPALVEVAGGAALVTAIGDDRALAEAIETLTNDEALRARLVAAGRVQAARYDWRAVAGRAWALYRELAS